MTGIAAERVSRSYVLGDGSRRPALAEVELLVEPGEFVCLLGPSGCGKTTLLNILAGLDRDHGGTVRYLREGGGTPSIGYMFQESRLLPWLTVADNLAFVLDGPASSIRVRVQRALDRIGLGDRGGDVPAQLSVGMQQRVAVARALLIEPDLLVMDEPFSSLDELTAQHMRRELLELWRSQTCTVVFVTHNPMEAAFLADRILLMSPGPGRVTGEIDLRERLPRPRRTDDPRVWEASREAVARLGPEASAA